MTSDLSRHATPSYSGSALPLALAQLQKLWPLTAALSSGSVHLRSCHRRFPIRSTVLRLAALPFNLYAKLVRMKMGLPQPNTRVKLPDREKWVVFMSTIRSRRRPILLLNWYLEA